MSLFKRQSQFNGYIAKLIIYAQEQGFLTSLREVARPVEMQRLYINTGRSRTMNSLHLQCVAADIYFQINGRMANRTELEVIARFWESLDPLNSWGGMGKTLKDEPHFSTGIVKPEWVRLS
jgi:hypothetical protein